MKRTLLILYSVVTLGVIFIAIYWLTIADACVHYDELLMYSAENPVRQSVCNQDGMTNVGMGIFLLLAAGLYTVVTAIVFKMAGYKLVRDHLKE